MNKKGYVTFVKENKKNDVFLRNYTFNHDVVEGSEIACAYNLILSDNIEDSLSHINKEEWSNLIFLYVEVVKEHRLNKDGSNIGTPISKDVKVLNVFDKEYVMRNITNSVTHNGEQRFTKYVKAINLTIDDRNKIIGAILNKSTIEIDTLLAPFAYYQYNDKEAYNKLKKHEPIIPSIRILYKSPTNK